ncbi:hypothetical protein C0991_007533 [Blastosporella zonata]|nr:hypothetical protein C0991_007533 [Blastosporella zonata]
MAALEFLNGAGPSFNDDGFGRGGARRGPVRKERDDKYETNSDDVRAQFEEHGEIKTFFDLISTRGMVFVTYFDLRAAERARDRLQGSEISGRPIDVHYSLPRDDNARSDRDKNQQLQGTLQVTLRNSASGAPLDDNEVRRKFQQFGDVKTVTPVGDRSEHAKKPLTAFDTKAFKTASWTSCCPGMPVSHLKGSLENVMTGTRAVVSMAGVVDVGADAEWAVDEAVPPSDDRLEQARKVQQLLAALKQPAPSAPPPPGPGLPPPGPMPSMPPPPMQQPPTGPGSYYGQPPNPAAMPSYPPYGALPPPPKPTSTPPAAGGAPSAATLSSLPPNILALLQSAQQAQARAQQGGPLSAPPAPGPPGQYGSMMMQPLNGLASTPPAPPGGQAQQYQQLMSFLGNINEIAMLVLSTLHNLLSQALTPELHTAVLLTTAGQLVAVAADGHRAKDEIWVVVGLAMEIWQETQEQEFSMVDCELGRIVVVPVDDQPPSQTQADKEGEKGEYEPLMLLALNSTTGVDWEELQTKRDHRLFPAAMRALRAYSALAHHARQRAQPFVPPTRRQDAYSLVAPDLQHLRSSLLGLLGSAHPGLSEIARYYFVQPSQQMRSLLVLLFAHATNGLGTSWPAKDSTATTEAHSGLSAELDTPLIRPDVLNNWHPAMPNNTASFASVFDLRPPGLYALPPVPPVSDAPRIPTLVSIPRLLPAQLRLAQIVEMIHMASVLHDDVHDITPEPADEGFGNKLSILAGDFLLGRASAALSRLGEAEVVELIASVIANQAEGEMLRIQSAGAEDAWEAYLRKTYLKTASLMAKGARAAVVLGGCTDGVWKDVAYAYGRNLGIAYQLVEDTLEYEAHCEGSSRGLVTGPILFAGEQHPELLPLIRRNLASEGDVEQARQYVTRSDGIERTRELAISYADKARQALRLLPDSEHKIALDVLADCAVTRKW